MNNFTIIQHDLRLKMGLSCNEYCVADLIKRLSDGSNDGWCFASRSKIGEMLGLTKPTIITILQILVKLNLVESHPKTKDLRVTNTWNSFFLSGKESLQNGKESLPKRERKYKKIINHSGKESIPESKESLPNSKDSLPSIGQDSLPPSYSDILLQRELQLELQRQNPEIKKNDFSSDNFSNETLEEKKEETPPKVAPKGSPKKSKDETEEERQRKDLHLKMKESFEKKFPDYEWRSKDGQATNDLIKKIRSSFFKKHSRDPNFEESLSSFLFLINHLPPFYSENIDLKVIESKYSAVITKIKADYANGKSNGTNNTNASPGLGTNHHKSALELVIADHQRNANR